jgi:hypothetical protein
MSVYIPKPRYRLKSKFGKHFQGEEGIFFGKIGKKVMIRFYAGGHQRSVYGPPVTLDETMVERVENAD